MKKIFIGGFGGSGTRVIMSILKQGGYYVGEPYVNVAYDYLGLLPEQVSDKKEWFVPYFDKMFFKNNQNKLKKLLTFPNKDSWGIKHGHLMYIIDNLKEWHPDSVFIYVYRNPIDNMLNEYKTHIKYGDLNNNSTIDNKVKYYIDKSKEFILKSNLSIKLEDLVFDSENTIKKVLEFSQITDYDINDYLPIIKIPKTIGRGKEFYNKIDCGELGYDFNKKIDNELE